MNTCWNCNEIFSDDSLHRDEKNDRYFCHNCCDIIADIDEYVFDGIPNTRCSSCLNDYYRDTESIWIYDGVCFECCAPTCSKCLTHCSADGCDTLQCRSCMNVPLKTFQRIKNGKEDFICKHCGLDYTYCQSCGIVTEKDTMSNCLSCQREICGICNTLVWMFPMISLEGLPINDCVKGNCVKNNSNF